MGIMLAIVALVSWGIGDFLIQKSTRKFGDLVALFFITAFASLALLPFVARDIISIISTREGLPTLVIASVVILVAALFDFEALRVGKLSVVESVYVLEVPISVAFAAYTIGERLSSIQYLLVGAVFFGIALVTNRMRQTAQARLEKGVLFALIATVGMGASNFLYGVGARETSPLVINWFTSTFLVIVTAIALAWQSRLGEITRSWKRAKKLIVSVCVFDNLAWIAFATSMLFIPIGVATGISESYVALAAALGVYFNRESLKRHQWAGFTICLGAVIALSFMTEA